MNATGETYFLLTKRGIALFCCAFLFLSPTRAQKIIGVGTRYNDSFREWIIATEDKEVEGTLSMRWIFQNDWTQWDARVGDMAASIEQQKDDDPNFWVIRCNGVTVNAKTAWSGEFYRWKLNDGSHHFTWQSPYANILDEWSTDTSGDVFFQVSTYREGDPRDWIVLDELPEDVSLALRLTMIFLAIHFTAPRI